MMTDFNPMGCSPLEPSAGLKEPCTLRKKIKFFALVFCRHLSTRGANLRFSPWTPESQYAACLFCFSVTRHMRCGSTGEAPRR